MAAYAVVNTTISGPNYTTSRDVTGAPLAFDKPGDKADAEGGTEAGEDGQPKDGQIAMDAFTLRHHAAEALLRLTAALGPVPSGTSAPSNGLWMRLAEDRRHLADVSDAVREFLDGD